MRIISGKHKGRRIELLKDAGGKVRPTSEFAREAIFNILNHMTDEEDEHSVIGRAVLDICCGTGAFGLEALSRGAKSATFVDGAREALANARHNAQRMGETATVEFIQSDASKLPRARKQYSLVFLDPPYFENLITPTLLSLHNGGWLAKNALIVIEHDSKEIVEIPAVFSVTLKRKYGRATIQLLQAV